MQVPAKIFPSVVGYIFLIKILSDNDKSLLAHASVLLIVS